MRAWVNGELLDDPNGPAISVADHGFTVGDGVFEAVKVVDGQPFALTRHLARMARNVTALGLPELDDDAVRRGVRATLEGQDLPLGRIRITYTDGVAPLGSGRGQNAPTLVVVTAPMDPFEPTTAAVTVPWPRNERGALAGLKTTSYAENVVALARAAEHGASEAIFPNTAGNLCEGTGTNVFYVVDGELRTPTLAAGCLAGVTRALILEWFGGREVDAGAGWTTSAGAPHCPRKRAQLRPPGKCRIFRLPRERKDCRAMHTPADSSSDRDVLGATGWRRRRLLCALGGAASLALQAARAPRRATRCPRRWSGGGGAGLRADPLLGRRRRQHRPGRDRPRSPPSPAPPDAPAPRSFLAISGGGSNGAFGAGLLDRLDRLRDAARVRHRDRRQHRLADRALRLPRPALRRRAARRPTPRSPARTSSRGGASSRILGAGVGRRQHAAAPAGRRLRRPTRWSRTSRASTGAAGGC